MQNNSFNVRIQKHFLMDKPTNTLHSKVQQVKIHRDAGKVCTIYISRSGNPTSIYLHFFRFEKNKKEWENTIKNTFANSYQLSNNYPIY